MDVFLFFASLWSSRRNLPSGILMVVLYTYQKLKKKSYENHDIDTCWFEIPWSIALAFFGGRRGW